MCETNEENKECIWREWGQIKNCVEGMEELKNEYIEQIKDT